MTVKAQEHKINDHHVLIGFRKATDDVFSHFLSQTSLLPESFRFNRFGLQVL